MKAQIPDWLVDQVQAAEQSADKALAAAGLKRGKGDPVWEAMGHDLANKTLLRWFFEGNGTCRHGFTPQPMFLFMWKPDTINCPACMGAALLDVRGTDEDTRCDNCGEIPGDGLVHPIGATMGPLTILGGVCTICADGMPT